MPPRKTKHIEKESKEDKAPAASKKGKAGTASGDWDIFSDSFKDRLSQFISVNQEVLELKSNVEGSDQTDQINEKKERMAGRVEEAAADILKNELSTLEEWIRDQQNRLETDIKKIEEVYENTRASLSSSGHFTEDEIRDQVSVIQKKAQGKKEVYQNYDDLLTRAKAIYS